MREDVEARLAPGIRDILREAYEAGLRDGAAVSLRSQLDARPFPVGLRHSIMESIWLAPGIGTLQLVEVTGGKYGSIRTTIMNLKAEGLIAGTAAGWHLVGDASRPDDV